MKLFDQPICCCMTNSLQKAHEVMEVPWSVSIFFRITPQEIGVCFFNVRFCEEPLFLKKRDAWTRDHHHVILCQEYSSIQQCRLVVESSDKLWQYHSVPCLTSLLVASNHWQQEPFSCWAQERSQLTWVRCSDWKHCLMCYRTALLMLKCSSFWQQLMGYNLGFTW